MKLRTWTFYKAKEIKNITGETLLKGDFPFILLRPDFTKPNLVLGIGIDGKTTSTQVVDVINRELSDKDIYEIFKDKLGLISVDEIEELVINKDNVSKDSIRKENIDQLIKVYNIFIKPEAIEFDSKDYSTVEKIKEQGDKFGHVNFENMPLQQLVGILQSGLTDYNNRIKKLNDSSINEKERMNLTIQLSHLQSNLLVIYDQMIKKMDLLIGNQAKEINDLKKQLNDLKK